MEGAKIVVIATIGEIENAMIRQAMPSQAKCTRPAPLPLPSASHIFRFESAVRPSLPYHFLPSDSKTNVLSLLA